MNFAGFVPAIGNFFNVLSYTSRSGTFTSSTASALNLTESYAATNLLLIAGTNAFPSLTFTVAGGNTQTVCVPFQLLASAADIDGAVINLTLLLTGSPIASANGSPVAITAEIDFPGTYSFTAFAQDDKSATSWSTQSVALLTYPLHDLIVGGFRTNGVLKICMAGEPGKSYQVLVNSNLNTTNWVPSA